jgi:2-amino-4-hydroxy-6-hydroxymethyldihydropteridine diphosphokinase
MQHGVTEFGLSLGSNLGDRLSFLRRARAALAALPKTRISISSPVYETEPVDVQSAYRDCAFLNAVVILSSSLEPDAMSYHVHRIEHELGRRREPDRNAPRVIDIDVLYVDARVINHKDLTVPHPRWLERRFVVQPLADVRPDIVLPGTVRTVREILLSLPTEADVVRFLKEW